MKRFGWPAAVMFSMMAGLSACGGGGDAPAPPVQVTPPPAPVPTLQSLKIVDLGSLASQQSGVTEITPARFVLSSKVAETPYQQVDVAIAAADFARLAALVESADLTRTLGENTGIYAPCRHLGYEITIVRNNTPHNFAIPGGQTCGGASNAAFVKLMELYSELVLKYAPVTPR